MRGRVLATGFVEAAPSVTLGQNAAMHVPK
jgi:hypothetical protein